MKELAGPADGVVLQLPILPRSEGTPANQHFVLRSHTGEPIANRRYRASTGNIVIEGFTDSAGCSAVLDGYLGQLARFELVEHSYDEHFIIRDPLGEPVGNLHYKIRTANGTEVKGITDEAGQTMLFVSDKIEAIELLFDQISLEADEGVG